jgi:hypothetical protein
MQGLKSEEMRFASRSRIFQPDTPVVCNEAAKVLETIEIKSIILIDGRKAPDGCWSLHVVKFPLVT